MKSRKQYIRERITMIQTEARSILEAVLGAETTEQACQLLKSQLRDRKHLTYWLGQIGRRQDVRLGRDLDFDRYLSAVVESIIHQRSNDVNLLESKEEREMGKRNQKPVVVVKKGGKSRHAVVKSPNSGMEIHATMEEGASDSMTNGTTDLTTGGLAQAQQSETGTQPSALPTSDTPSQKDLISEPSQWPPIPEFDLNGVSLNQQYAIRRMVVLCDCCVQGSPEGIFDVLGRNFNDTGELMWWLRKIGKSHVADLVKGKDTVDAIRKAAHELYRELKEEIGRPVARW